MAMGDLIYSYPRKFREHTHHMIEHPTPARTSQSQLVCPECSTPSIVVRVFPTSNGDRGGLWCEECNDLI